MSANAIGKDIENIRGSGPHEGQVSQFFSVDQVRGFRPLFCFLNGKDRDILYLVFVSRKKQKEVQSILRRSQPSLCYDIKRIRRRLRFIFYLNSVFDSFVCFLESGRGGFNPEELDILAAMFYTSSFTLSANILGLSHVRVRYVYDKCLKRMESLGMWDEYEMFSVIRENLNTVRRRCRTGTLIMDEVFIPL